jgi:ribonuclease HII
MATAARMRAARERLRALATFDEEARAQNATGASCGTPRPERLEIAGCDEAGRGALAGPAVVACVQFAVAPLVTSTPAGAAPHRDLVSLAGIDDSKRLSPRERERLFEPIARSARFGIGVTSAEEIDRLGIVPALTLATRRAVAGLGRPPGLLLLDLGLTLGRSGDAPEVSFAKGDARSLHIAAASILAKVTRDRMLAEAEARFPGYGFERNKGYGTPGHLAALRRLGPSPFHRATFRVA